MFFELLLFVLGSCGSWPYSTWSCKQDWSVRLSFLCLLRDVTWSPLEKSNVVGQFYFNSALGHGIYLSIPDIAAAAPPQNCAIYNLIITSGFY